MFKGPSGPQILRVCLFKVVDVGLPFSLAVVCVCVCLKSFPLSDIALVISVTDLPPSGVKLPEQVAPSA